MEIQEAIDYLIKLRDDVNVIDVATDNTGFFKILYKKKDTDGDYSTGKEFYVTIYADSMYGDNPPNKPIEGKDYANIKSKLTDTVISKEEKEGRLMCNCVLEPIDKLPDWYDEDNMMEDFCPEIHEVYDNTFWLPINHGVNYFKF